MDNDFDREADLLYAYQFGQDAAKGNAEKIRAEFLLKFASDTEAEEQYQEGFSNQIAVNKKFN
jgi:hypothetical protein